MSQITQKNMSEEEVTQFLRNNPGFFDTHPELLTDVQWTSAQSGHTISFAEKQIAFLRDKMARLEKKMLELIEFGNENDELLVKFHQMALKLIRAKTLSEVLESVYVTIREDFALPNVAIRLWSAEETLEVGPEFEPVDEPQKEYVETLQSPYLGQVSQLKYREEFLRWLWTADEEIASVALLPLKDKGKTLGALLIGSTDSSKFKPNMGTMFLEQMADQVAAGISKYRL